MTENTARYHVGRFNQIGQQKPSYLIEAIENRMADEATLDALADKLGDCTDESRAIILRLAINTITLQLILSRTIEDDRYERWQAELARVLNSGAQTEDIHASNHSEVSEPIFA